MNYWIPTIILALVLIVLVAQLPWHIPNRQGKSVRAALDHRNEKNLGNSDIQREKV